MGMKVNDFLKMVRKATATPSLYVMGGWGYPLNDSNKDRTQSNSYNRNPERKKKIYAQNKNVFSWDCCGLCKGVIWGWYGNPDLKNGGASYATNGMPDYDAKEIMFKMCTEQSSDFSKIEAGEFLWLDGHCGIYLGDGLAAESTPIWKDGAQVTAVANIGQKKGYNSRKWTYHGHLKCIDYSEKPQPTPTPTPTPDPKTMDGYTVGNTYKVICKETLNVRDKATTKNSLVITELKPGTSFVCKALTHDEEGNTWMRIDSPASGWICCIYHGDKYVGDAEKTIDGYTVGAIYKVVAKKGLNVRSGPSTSYSCKETLAYNTSVKCVDVKVSSNKKETWMQISNGWIAAKYYGETYVK